VRLAVVDRRELLHRLGIGPDDPTRHAKLSEVERSAVGREIAGRSGLTFLAHAPDGFSGRAQRADGPMASSAYTIISDGQRFILLRATPALRALHGQSVAVTRDANGRLLVRRALDKDRGR